MGEKGEEKKTKKVKKKSSCQKDVKLSKRCQVIKKMSSCQKVKHIDYGRGSQKN